LFALAYVGFVVILFLPGMAFSEAFQIGRSFSLAERLGLWLGFGTAANVLMLILQSSRYFGGTPLELEEALTGVSAIAIAVSVFMRKRFSLYVKPSRADLMAFLLVVAQGLLVYAHYVKYPIFPQFQSVDFTSHVQIVTDLQKGVTSPIPSGVLYYGVYMLMVELFALTNGAPLVITQRTMEILVVLSPLLVYAAASTLSDSKRISLTATFIYVSGGFVWFGSVFNAGLYPNFYGIFSTLFVVVAIATVLKAPRNPSTWAVYLISIANALFSHYSTLTVFPAIVALPITELVFTRRLSKTVVLIAALPALLSTVGLLQYPSLISTLEGFAKGGAGTNVSNDTHLSLILSGYPFLRYVAVEITSDSSTLFLLAMAAAGAYASLRTKKPLAALPPVWLLAAAIAAPANQGAWRFSYVGLLPLCLLAGMGFGPLYDRLQRKNVIKRRKGKRPLRGRRSLYLVGTAVLLILVIAGSWGTLLLYDALTQGTANGQAQRDVYSSMIWFSQNTPADSELVSITDWRYLYTGLIIGRHAAYSELTTPDALLMQLNGTKDLYVVLTALATVSAVSSNPFPLYSNDTHFQLVYRNPDVQIYRVVSFGTSH